MTFTKTSIGNRLDGLIQIINKNAQPLTLVPVAQLPHFRYLLLFFRKTGKVFLQIRSFKRG